MRHELSSLLTFILLTHPVLLSPGKGLPSPEKQINACSRSKFSYLIKTPEGLLFLPAILTLGARDSPCYALPAPHLYFSA